MYYWLAVPVAFVAVLFGLAYFQPVGFMRWMELVFPRVLWSVQTKERVAALTIDDAPSEYTAEILDVLREHGVCATFFVIGSYAVEQGNEILHRMLAEGHELGNHTWDNKPSAFIGSDAFSVSFVDTHKLLTNVIEEHTGECKQKSLSWFRPGHGWFHNSMLSFVESFGYRTALGNVYPHDPQIPCTPLNVWHVKRGIRPGAVVILHDRWHTAATLRSLLPQLKQQGYRLVTLTELTAQK